MTDQISRRDFLKLVSMTGGGLALAVFLDGCASAPDEATATAVGVMPTTAASGQFDWAPNIYLKLDNQGTLTVMARCPVFGGDITSYDDSAARAVSGVRDVVQIGKKIAVIAEHSWAAIQGRKALTIEWDEGRNAELSSVELTAQAFAATELRAGQPQQVAQNPQ